MFLQCVSMATRRAHTLSLPEWQMGSELIRHELTLQNSLFNENAVNLNWIFQQFNRRLGFNYNVIKILAWTLEKIRLQPPLLHLMRAAAGEKGFIDVTWEDSGAMHQVERVNKTWASDVPPIVGLCIPYRCQAIFFITGPLPNDAILIRVWLDQNINFSRNVFIVSRPICSSEMKAY